LDENEKYILANIVEMADAMYKEEKGEFYDFGIEYVKGIVNFIL